MFTELLSQCIQEAGVEYAHLEPPCPEEEIAQAERAAQEAQQPAGPLDEKGQPIIVIEEPEEPLPRRKGGGHG